MKTTRNIDSIENGIIIDHIQVGKWHENLRSAAFGCT